MTVYEITEARLKAWANKFVTLYLEGGEMMAGKWLSEEVPEEFHEEIQPYVEGEFEQKGYELK